MKLKIVLLILALILGAAAVFGVIAYVNSVRASVEEEIEKVEVLVAAQNIPGKTPVETLIERNMVTTSGVPRKYLAEGVLTSLEDYRGYVAANHINKGEQITTTKFARPEDMGLVFIIPDGMLAVSIPVNEIVGVSKLIDVGDRVNVIVTFFPGDAGEDSAAAPAAQLEGAEAEGEVPVVEKTVPGASDEGIKIDREITRTLLWNVEVLYIGTRVQTGGATQESGFLGTQTGSDTGSAEVKVITVAVTPEDSEKLVFSEEMGSVWLALVPVDGIEEEETPGATLDNIFN
jgi:pilus assembly protein CpaB